MLEILKKVKRKLAAKSKDATPKATSKAIPEVVDQKALNREKRIRNVMGKTDWTHAKAESEMSIAKQQFGLSFADYDRYDFHTATKEQQKACYDEIVRKKAQKEARKAKKNEKFVIHVMEKTGWTREEAVKKMDRALKVTGTSYEHYSIYRFWDLTEEEQKTYFSKGDADLLRNTYNKNPEQLKVFMNKDLFCEKFEKYIGRAYCSTDDLNLKTFKKKFGVAKKIIYKPRSASGGRGIQVFAFDDTTLESVYNQLKALPAGVIETYITQHPEMQKLSLHSVNTIRVVTIRTDDPSHGIETNKVHFVYAGVRMGQGDSVVDNLHCGGMIAVLDLDTGVVATDAVNFANDVFEKHPDTGVVIRGFKVPYVQEMKAMIEEAGKNINGYLGWDIAITENGPIVIEVNTHPGADGLQTPYVPMKKGMRYVVEKYLPTKKPAAAKQVVQEAEQPYGTKISLISKEGIEFYWKKPERANGYEVYRSYKAMGEPTLIATINKRNVGDYTDAEFDHTQKAVYYSIRSFLEQKDGTKVYSEITKPVKAVPYTELTLERDATYMYDGMQRNIRAFYDWGEPEEVVWTSDNEAIATVSQDGVISAVATGVCTLTCSCAAIGQSATTKVVVNRAALEPLGEIKSRFAYDAQTGYWKNSDAAPTNDATIVMVGDMMCGKRQMNEQYTEDGGWNFNESFEYVRELTQGSDFAIGNLETLLAAGWPYMSEEVYIKNKNNCNAPSRFLDAVRYGGFDAVAMSNNHNCDGGKRALLETIDQVEKYQLANTGVFRDQAAKRFMIIDVNGIKVGYVSYMSRYTGFNGKDADWDEADKDILINVFDIEKAKSDVAACRAAGAEYIISYMHWGTKNFRKITDKQRMEAQEMADAGADYIVGSNPHLVQVYDVIRSADDRAVPCFYSIGNFIALMKQVVGNRDSVAVKIRLSRNADGKVVLAENHYIPYYTYTKHNGKLLTPVSMSKSMNTTQLKPGREKTVQRIAKAIGNKISSL